MRVDELLFSDAVLRERAAWQLGRMVKAGEAPQISYALAGRLYVNQAGYLLLSIPATFVRGIYSNLDEHGLELPPSAEESGSFWHVIVMTPEEIAGLGGPERIIERGKMYAYTLGRLYETEPSDWPGMEKLWFLRIHSPQLQELRRSYGLESLPSNGDRDFYFPVAVRRRGVLGRNEKSRTTAA